MKLRGGSTLRVFVCGLLLLGLAAPSDALVPPADTSGLRERAFQNPELRIINVFEVAPSLEAEARGPALSDLSRLGAPPEMAHLDRRGGRWAGLVLSRPLIPGSGAGNELRWTDLGLAPSAGPKATEQAAWSAFAAFLNEFRRELRIDPDEIAMPASVSSNDNGNLIQIYATRVVGGVPVRDSYLIAVINHGNLVLFGVKNWGDVTVSTTPDLPEAAAQLSVAGYVSPFVAEGSWKNASLALVPKPASGDLAALRIGNGYEHRLVWVLSPSFRDSTEHWEALVDAQTGDVLDFQDTNHYGSDPTTRNVVGGVLPLANDGVSPGGIEIAGYPMPFADVTHSGTLRNTDSGGNLALCLQGTISTTLAGRFVRMSDNCGAISASDDEDINLGTSGGTDCTVPAGQSPGDTHSSRTGFYELNRIKEQARGQLPNNSWLMQQLTSNMNIPNTCNAFWNGVTVNFYRRSGNCANTGELAGVFDHEWGHGMDNNGTNATIARPGEGVADIFAALRLNQSCIGRGFNVNGANCGGYGDACTNCSGIREIDWDRHAAHNPRDIGDVATRCPSQGTLGLCGRTVHCEGLILGETLWDLIKRDLTGPAAGLDADTALELGTRLFYNASSPVGDWFNCSPPLALQGGCVAGTSGYLGFLAVDDDNGTLLDGTPHMEAIHAAFDRHGIACAIPAPIDSGCAGAPTTAPTVTVTALDRGADVHWTPVAGAAKYRIYRADGVNACDYGKIFVTETDETSFVDDGLQNGRVYAYAVVAVGSNDSCRGPMSSCSAAQAQVTPAPGPNLNADPASVSLRLDSGDGDEFLDNCEQAEVGFDIFNIGAGDLMNVQILDVTVSDPNAVTLFTQFPAIISPTLSACGVAHAAILFRAKDLTHGETLTFTVRYTAQGILVPRTQVISIPNTETDFVFAASKTYSFEDPNNLEGWEPIQGTWSQASDGGASSSLRYLRSSSGADSACDQIRSPTMKLAANSTLSLFNNFDIEPMSGGSWWDRANVAVFGVDSSARDVITATGGRLYNASGPNGGCITATQAGWAASMPTWAQSTWTSAALGHAGPVVRLDIAYSTDPEIAGTGFKFDEVTVTNAIVQAPDTQSDVCSGDLTPVATATATQTRTPTLTPVLTSTPTLTQTRTPTNTRTQTNTRSPTRTRTFTRTRTSTRTGTATPIPTETDTATPTLSATPSFTGTPTEPPTATPSSTRSFTATATAPPSATPTPTPTTEPATLGQPGGSSSLVLWLALVLAFFGFLRRGRATGWKRG